MTIQTERLVGQTKDVGFEIGVSKTVPVSKEQAWDFLFSEEGSAIWLGETNWSDFEVNKTYRTTDGIEGLIRVFKPMSHIRLTWKLHDWDNFSTLQIRVMDAKGKARISFHQEKLAGPEQRTEMKNYWDGVMALIIDQLNP